MQRGQILLLSLPRSQMFVCYCAVAELIHTLTSQEAALEIQRGRTGVKPAANVATSLMECPFTLTDSYFQEGERVRKDTERWYFDCAFVQTDQMSSSQETATDKYFYLL